MGSIPIAGKVAKTAGARAALQNGIEAGVTRIAADQIADTAVHTIPGIISDIGEGKEPQEIGINALKAEAGDLAVNVGSEAVLNIAQAAVKKVLGAIGGGTHVLPKAEDLKMSQTVQNHINDIIKKGPNAGQLSRPYIDSDGTTLLLKEIMESAEPVPDAVFQSGIKWNVSGTFRGSTGTWELVVDTSTNTVVHFNFVAQ